MEKPILRERYLFGDEIVEIYPFFIYELIIYRDLKNMFGVVSSSYYKSDKLIKVPKYTKKGTFKRYINLIGVPKSFVEENNLQLYQNEKRTRTVSR